MGAVRERVLHAMSLSRTEKALTFLVSLAVQEPLRTAKLAAKALLLHRHDARILEMLRNAGTLRPEITQLVMECVPDGEAPSGID